MHADDTNELLDRLATDANCLYLSDLHADLYGKAVRLAVEGLDARDYGIRLWNEAIAYITGKSASFSDPQDARAHLLGALCDAQ